MSWDATNQTMQASRRHGSGQRSRRVNKCAVHDATSDSRSSSAVVIHAGGLRHEGTWQGGIWLGSERAVERPISLDWPRSRQSCAGDILWCSEQSRRSVARRDKFRWRRSLIHLRPRLSNLFQESDIHLGVVSGHVDAAVTKDKAGLL